jgi:predicted nucleic acid-binding protein
VIAAVAQAYGATLLHYDRHFDAVEPVTGQPMLWLARRGSLD